MLGLSDCKNIGITIIFIKTRFSIVSNYNHTTVKTQLEASLL